MFVPIEANQKFYLHFLTLQCIIQNKTDLYALYESVLRKNEKPELAAAYAALGSFSLLYIFWIAEFWTVVWTKQDI